MCTFQTVSLLSLHTAFPSFQVWWNLVERKSGEFMFSHSKVLTPMRKKSNAQNSRQRHGFAVKTT
jgi:hypothetical protein